MKYLILCLMLTQGLLAQTYTKKELVQLSLERLFPDGQNIDEKADMTDIVKEWNNLFDLQILERDQNKFRKDWNKVFPIKRNKTHKISGSRIFYGVIPKKYRYEITEDQKLNSLIVTVRMHFYPSKTYIRRMEKLHAANDPDMKYYPKLDLLMKQVANNVKDAEDRWNAQAPLKVRFKFVKVNKASEAHYSIKLVTHFGALYDKFITAPAYADILSHEVGHMMGLDDEYSMITSNVLPVHSVLEMVSLKHKDRNYEYTSYQDMRCNLESIMCLKDTIYPYHINHILGRIR